jgi:UDP-N-acetylmuramyl pentapeptide phosphotransferase/UDP-N-acetylglucosamine-1-phosphate transferase
VTLAVLAVAGCLAGLAAWRALCPVLQAPVFARTNHRGASVPTAGGLVPTLAVLVVEGALTLAETALVDTDPDIVAARRVVVLGVMGFGLLGLLDDLAGVGESGGFRGHLRALARGRLTTGGIKLFGGAALALVTVDMARPGPGTTGRLVADAALVALAANLANLLDRAPGRVAKVGLLSAAALAAGTGLSTHLAGPVLVVGALCALVRADLRERVMLGDSGANLVGAALGLGVVLACAPGTRTTVLAVLVALNLTSEVVSFSRVIDRVPPLRWADRLGRAG